MSSPQTYTCNKFINMELLDADIPLVLPKMSGVKSVNSKSINSAHSQKVLVSENDLPINRDDDFETSGANQEADKVAGKDPNTATTSTAAKPSKAPEEKDASTTAKEAVQSQQPSQHHLREQQQRQKQKHQQERPPEQHEGRLECIQEEKMDEPKEARLLMDAMVLTAPKKRIRSHQHPTAREPQQQQQQKPPPQPTKPVEKKEKPYKHQPLTEDLLHHHTQLEKLKVSWLT